MAKYNREFLVPYLQNICALHLVEKKIDRQIYIWEHDYKTIESRLVPKAPQREKELDSSAGCLQYITGFLLVLAGLGWVLIFVAPNGEANFLIPFWIFSTLLFGTSFCYCCYENHKCAKRNQEMEEMYQQKWNQYLADLEDSKILVEAEKTESLSAIDAWRKEQQDVQGLLQKAYGANIIPSRYRDIYAAVYLYDWFSTGGSNDLDHALSMFVLEEIKDRLDTIIEKQSEMLLNQSIMIANQYKSLEQQEAYEKMMRQKLCNIQTTQEEQLSYAKMIESNTASIAYFTAAEYIKNI